MKPVDTALAASLDAIQTNLDILKSFVAEHPGLPLQPDVTSTPPRLTSWSCSSDREEVLATVGELLGTENWIAKTQPSSSYYTWERTFDGLVVVLMNAASKPDELPVQVPPSAFPLMLKNVEE